MTATYAYTVNGRTSMDVPPAEYESEISSPLRRMNEQKLYAFTLWRHPEGVEWGDPIPKGWVAEYLQSAGTAQGMNLELRRIEDGEPRLYALGRGGDRSAESSREIVWGPDQNRVDVYADEIFTAAETIPVYLEYYRTGTVPEGFSLRLLDLANPAAEEPVPETTP